MKNSFSIMLLAAASCLCAQAQQFAPKPNFKSVILCVTGTDTLAVDPSVESGRFASSTNIFAIPGLTKAKTYFEYKNPHSAITLPAADEYLVVIREPTAERVKKMEIAGEPFHGADILYAVRQLSLHDRLRLLPYAETNYITVTAEAVGSDFPIVMSRYSQDLLIFPLYVQEPGEYIILEYDRPHLVESFSFKPSEQITEEQQKKLDKEAKKAAKAAEKQAKKQAKQK